MSSLIFSLFHNNLTVDSSIMNSQNNSFYSYSNFHYNYNVTKKTFESLIKSSTLSGDYNLFNYYILLFAIWFCGILTPPKFPVFSYLTPISEALLLNLTLVICFPVIIFANSLLSIVRLLIRLHFKYVHKGQFILMKSADAFWSIEEHAQSCNFNCVYVVEGDCNIRSIRAKFQKLAQDPTYKRMRMVVARKFGFYCWKRLDKDNDSAHFDIRNHVKYLTKEPLTESQVFERIEEFTDNIFEQDKPAWEALIVPRYSYDKDNMTNGLTSPKKKYYALIFRIHHSIMDGISAGQIIRNEIADTKVELSVDPCAPIRFTMFQRIGSLILLVTIGVRTLIRSLTLNESNCFHTRQTLTGPKRLGWSRKINLHTLKVLKDKTRTTTTAVLLSCFAGALKNLAKKRGLVLPPIIHAGPTVAMLPYPDTKPQNRFILAHLPISTGEGKSRMWRLKEVHKSAKDLQKSPELIMNKAMLWLVGRWPILVMNIFMRFVHATVLISNVPGFKETTHLFGGELVDAVGWTPLKGTTGIGMCLFSYNGTVRAAIIGDRVSLPNKSDVKDLIHEFENEIESLSQDLGSPSCYSS